MGGRLEYRGGQYCIIAGTIRPRLFSCGTNMGHSIGSESISHSESVRDELSKTNEWQEGYWVFCAARSNGGYRVQTI